MTVASVVGEELWCSHCLDDVDPETLLDVESVDFGAVCDVCGREWDTITVFYESQASVSKIRGTGRYGTRFWRWRDNLEIMKESIDAGL